MARYNPNQIIDADKVQNLSRIQWREAEMARRASEKPINPIIEVL